LATVAAILFLVSASLICSCNEGRKIGEEEKAQNRTCVRITSPLTGLPLKDSSSAARRAVAVKVENQADARPQSGLDLAELVYEEIVEGSITRFIAIYLDNEASEMGPVRSARPMDVNILAPINPLLVLSGGSPVVMQTLERSKVYFITEDNESYFWRARDRRAPHNLYTSTALVRSALKDWNIETFQWKEDLFRFGEPGAYATVTALNVDYPGPYKVGYQYDAASGRYLRSQAGQPMTDKKSGQPIAPTTVIIQYVELEDTGVKDMAGSLSPDAVVVGSGEALVFTAGKVFYGTWEKAASSDRTVYRDENGEEITIRPGQVWIHLIPKAIRVEYQIAATSEKPQK